MHLSSNSLTERISLERGQKLRRTKLGADFVPDPCKKARSDITLTHDVVTRSKRAGEERIIKQTNKQTNTETTATVKIGTQLVLVSTAARK